MGKTEENDKSKLELKSASKPGGPFEIHSLNNFREVGNYTWIAREITDEMGFPNCVKDTDDCHYCEGQLFVMRHGAKKTSQSTDSFGQVLTIINHETRATNIFTRAVHPLDNDEWTPWQMVATGDPKLITENNDINKVLSTLRQQIENDSKRIETAENSLLASATVRFDRIEENEATINVGEVDVLKEVIYYKPANKFVAADNEGNYWDTWDGMEAYMSGEKLREDKLYLCGDELYLYDSKQLVKSTGSCTSKKQYLKDVAYCSARPYTTIDNSYLTTSSIAANKNFQIKIYDIGDTSGFKIVASAAGSTAVAYGFYLSEDLSNPILTGRFSVGKLNDIIPVPTDAKFLAVTEYKSEYTNVYHSLPNVDCISAAVDKLVVVVEDDTIYISRKYDSNNDILIVFKKCLNNNIMHFYKIGLCSNSAQTAKFHYVQEIHTTIFTGSTDLVGPVNTEYGWIGGNHLLNGEKTATTEEVKIYIDDIISEGFACKYADKVCIKVKNRLFASSERPLIDEYVSYNIFYEGVIVNCEHRYLSDFAIKNYYGAQSAFKGEVMTPNGKYTDFSSITDGSFAWSAYPAFRRIVNRKANCYESLYIAPIGLGKTLGGYIRSGSKDYFDLLYQVPVIQGSSNMWTAVYNWFTPYTDNSDALVYASVNEDGRKCLYIDVKTNLHAAIPIPSFIGRDNAHITGDINKISVSGTITVDTDIPESFVLKDGTDTKHSAMVVTCRDFRVIDAIKRIRIRNFDNTREYVLKKFHWNRYRHDFEIEIGTTKSNIAAYSISCEIGSKTSGVRIVQSADKNVEAWIDFDSLYANPANIEVESNDFKSYGLNIDYINSFALKADEERSLIYSASKNPMLLLDYGKISKKFYFQINYGYLNKFWAIVMTADTINNNHFLKNDNNLKQLFNFNEFPQVQAIRALHEMNNGNLLICTYSVSPGYGNIKGHYSEYYVYNPSDKTLVKKFEGNWRKQTADDGTEFIGANEAFMTNVWDLSEYGNTIVVSERVTQGVGGKVWYSKDGGDTWYVIFNAYPEANDGNYPIRMPSGWDTTIEGAHDFDRPISGTTPLLGGGNFHVHGVTYDHYRNQIIMVSGDATYVQGSYSAVWVLKNPDQLGLYPASVVNGVEVAEGGTNIDGIPKMLKGEWIRVGLHKNDEGNNVGHNMQFVNCVAFKNHLAFGSDCYPNGIYIMENPEVPSLSNIKLVYSLDVPEEVTLTHCASACTKLPSMPYLWVFHREPSSWNAATSINDRKAYVLASDDGLNWSCAWEDDTLDENRKTKISWGAKIIGHKEELVLRYKGFSLNDSNVLRHIRL